MSVPEARDHLVGELREAVYAAPQWNAAAGLTPGAESTPGNRISWSLVFLEGVWQHR